ncbi:hypothetical protein K1719_012073 [Acacia pycnantha]|nr:hypothetical protein K1719_012073 [Acacia pycnantha]
MNLIVWNCRGAASKTFPERIKDLIKGVKVNILILIETCDNRAKVDRIVRKLGFNNWIMVEYSGYAGGI